MKKDRRILYTKKVIKDSFFEILSEKPYGKITIKEICERADINRATFYSHYLDIYDLTDEIKQTAIDDIKSKIKQFSNSNAYDLIHKFLLSLQQQEYVYANLIFSGDTSSFFTRLFLECKDEILSHWNQLNTSLTPGEQDWVFTFMASGCAGIIKNWVHSGMIENPEQVATFINQLISHSSTMM